MDSALPTSTTTTTITLRQTAVELLTITTTLFGSDVKCGDTTTITTTTVLVVNQELLG